jgi:hypothetical protein
MLNKLLAIISLLISVTVNAQTFQSCPKDFDSQQVLGESVDSKKWLEFWTPQIERLYGAIPAISPSEEKWLKEELRASLERSSRAMKSQEYSYWMARMHLGTLLSIIKNQLSEGKRNKLDGWTSLSYVLIREPDNGVYLERILRSGVITESVIPPIWVYGSLDGLNASTFNDGQRRLATTILGCIIPQLKK